MMHKTDDVAYFSDEDCEVIKLSYSDKSAFSLLLVLPKKDNDFSFMNASKFDVISQGLSIEEVKIALPKFKFETEFDVKKMLEEKGMKHLFDKPDFTPLVDINHPASKAVLPKLKISQIKQKAALECNEDGTEASVVTVAVIMIESACMPKASPKEIRFDGCVHIFDHSMPPCFSSI